MFNKQTDDELIEKIRKYQASSKKSAYFYFILVLGFAILIPLSYDQTTDFIEKFPNDDYRKFAWSGLQFGIIMGIALSVMGHQAINTLFRGIEGLQGNRQDKLLLKYHDRLKEAGIPLTENE